MANVEMGFADLYGQPNVGTAWQTPAQMKNEVWTQRLVWTLQQELDLNVPLCKASQNLRWIGLSVYERQRLESLVESLIDEEAQLLELEDAEFGDAKAAA